MKITKEDLERLNFALMEVNKVYGELFAKLTLDEMERERLRQQFYVATSNDNPDKTSDRAEFHLAFPPLALPSPASVPKKLKVVNERTSAVRELKNQTEEDDEMMNATKRADGRWQKTKVVAGKKYYLYGKTKKEVIDKYKNFKVPKPKGPTLYEFAMQWLTTFKKTAVAEATYDNYERLINTHVVKIDEKIAKITSIRLQEFLNTLPATRIRESVYKLLRQIFKKAFELDMIKKDPTAFITAGKINRKVIDSFTFEEQEKIIRNLTPGDKFSDRILFYLVTGARPNEIKCVDKIKDGAIHIAGTKTKLANRWVVVSKAISDRYAEKEHSFFHFDEKNFREYFQIFLKKIGVRGDGTVYMLRHTFATNLFILGVPDKIRQVFMGHSSTKLTNDVYTSYDPTVTADDIRNLYGEFYPVF